MRENKIVRKPKIAERRIVALFLGMLNGQRIHRFPVRVRVNQPLGTVDDWLNPSERWYAVDARSASDAARLIWETETDACTEVRVYGPWGGEQDFYQGYESAIGRQMWRNHEVDAHQLTFIAVNPRTAETEGLL